jgi:ubiquinone/menaquinone biosynthesis C-methylase UbiE
VEYSRFDTKTAIAQKSALKHYFEAAAPLWKHIYQLDDVYAKIHQERKAIVLRLVKQINLPKNSKFLEVGCGAGITAVTIAQLGYLVEAIDVADAMVQSTRACAAQAAMSQRVTASCGDIHHLDFPDETFSVVLALGVLPWLPSAWEPVAEMVRVLCPGGYLITNVDNQWRLNRLLDPLTLAHRMAIDPLRRWHLLAPSKAPRTKFTSPGAFDALLKQVGFEKLWSATLGFGPFSFLNLRLPESVGLRLHSMLQSMADRGVPVIRSAGAQYVVLARKIASDSPNRH